MAPKGNPYPISQFVNQDMVADLQCRNHGARRYFERLNDKSSYKKCQQQSHSDGFRVFAESGLGFYRLLGFHMRSFLRLGSFNDGHESPVLDFQSGEERLLRNLYFADLFHSFLTFLLSLQQFALAGNIAPVSYTHLRAHETPEHLVCRLLLE